MKFNYSLIQTELFFIILFAVLLGFAIATVLLLFVLGLPLDSKTGCETVRAEAGNRLQLV
ncbi:MAG: hypothetical protein IJ443_00510 [Firmicutes bacterium]|nr:hypothetical protein [Bacillota bacterium]